ncbi:MAG TPA: 2-oxoacid:acceptor oxidoreductase family protein [Kofleriaceae bacterium]|nr:2-oxoacid:acceptor oxidoreductase family protein [Kofleriaceae bacterium]
MKLESTPVARTACAAQIFGADLAARLARGEAIDVRGDGKAGGGLVLVMQALGAALARDPLLAVHEWPLFSSARRGANVRAFLRVARGSVEAACQVLEPDVALLMNEAAGEEVDFADGTAGAIYVVNTRATPQEVAQRYRLGGRIATIAGDDLGREHLGRPLGNVPVLAALVRATGLVKPALAREALAAGLAKRRIPDALVAANLRLYDAALDRVTLLEVARSPTTAHPRARFSDYGPLPVGAQFALRTSHGRRTAGYGRPGVKIEFADPQARCNGCTLCVVQCPDGIIEFTPDPARGAIVHGARFATHCKACRECVTACPLDLFHEVPAVTRPDAAIEEA